MVNYLVRHIEDAKQVASGINFFNFIKSLTIAFVVACCIGSLPGNYFPRI